MFWKFNLLTSNIDTLLDKEDVTLHEILDEDDVLQECKAQNRKLIEFLVQPSNIEELVNLITTEPSDNVDEKARYNYPNTACELLTSDVCEIYEKLCGEEVLMGKVYGFLESDGPLNPLLASFFSKVMGLLINRQSDMIVDFIQSKDDFVGQLLHHIGTSAIMDLLLRLISCISSPEIRRNCINWLNEQNLIQKLINMIHPSQTEEKHCNASQSLCDIIRLSRQQMAQMQESANSDPLLTSIESQETVTSLLTNMFTGEKNESVLVNGLSVIQTLLEFRKIGPECPDGIETLTPLDQERLDRGINNTLAALVPILKDIHQMLIEPPKQHYQTMSNSSGVLDPPLGNTRLQVARLISTLLLLTNRHCINVELANLGTLNCLLDLFFKYSWNNFLHTQVEKCVCTILLGSQPESEDGTKTESPLLSQLLLDCRLVQRILDAWEDNDVQQARPGGSRKGYMGHLTRIANHLADSMDKGNNTDRLKEIFLELPDDVRDKWDNFTSTTMADVNKQNTVDLVGNHLLHSSSEDDDPDFSNIPFPQDAAMQQAFSDYQLHQMTSNFIDQFGFNEEEFAEQEEHVEAPFMNRISSINFDIPAPEDNSAAASLFEQACNERMQQFDDQNSDDEDLWEEKEITFAQPGRTNPSGAPIAHSEEGSRSDDSDGSTDSEEELDSPAIIRQIPTSTDAEKMDIDAVPVAMDTGTGWDTTPAAPTSTEDWANFDGATSSSSNEKTDENWADFSNFSSIDAAPLNSTDPGPPRTTSPVAMDTADSNSNPSGRTAAYMVGSAPADLASEVSSTSSPSSDGQQQDDNKTSIPDSCVSSTTGDVATSSGDIDSQNCNAGSVANSTTTTTTATTTTPGSPTRSNDSDSPSNSFLAASGLMRKSESSAAEDDARPAKKKKVPTATLR